MKKLVIAAMLATLLYGCDSQENNNQNADSAKSEANANTQNAVSMNAGISIYNGEVAFVQSYTDTLQKKADAANIKYDLVDAKNDQDNQYQQVDKFIADGKNILFINIVNTNEESASEIIKRAKAKNIPVIFYHRYPGDKVLKDYEKAYFVGTKASQSGVIQGEIIAKQWHEHPEWDLNKDGLIQYVILKGKEGNPDAEGRTKWAPETILHYPGNKTEIQQIAIENANWQRTEAKDITSKWLDDENVGSKIELIISNNDAMALGALDALEEKGRNLPIFGVDALPEVVKAIQDGKIAGSVGQDIDSQVDELLVLASNLISGTDPKTNLKGTVVNQRVILPYKGVDKNNASAWLKK